MANIKITELNGITKKASDDVLAIVDVSANETKKISVEDLVDKNIELIAVVDTAPAECSAGDKYYNITTKKIYTATATDTWSETGEDPISGILYIVYNEQASYSWDGTDLVSVGGGKEDIVIDDEQPTDPDVKLWIDTGEIGSQVSEITNSYSTSTGLGYSANYANNNFQGKIRKVEITGTTGTSTYEGYYYNDAYYAGTGIVIGVYAEANLNRYIHVQKMYNNPAERFRIYTAKQSTEYKITLFVVDEVGE